MIKDTTGVLLAGGQSSRFGSNKALVHLAGRPLISHAAHVLGDLFADLLLVTNTPETYRFLGWPTVGDIHPGQGPLAGIHAALLAAGQAIFVVACDMPRLNPRLISMLCALPGAWDVALPWTRRGPEPLFALYRLSALPVVQRQLAKGEGKIRLALEDLRLRRISEEEIVAVSGDLRSFDNINRPNDLEALKEKR